MDTRRRVCVYFLLMAVQLISNLTGCDAVHKINGVFSESIIYYKYMRILVYSVKLHQSRSNCFFRLLVKGIRVF